MFLVSQLIARDEKMKNTKKHLIKIAVMCGVFYFCAMSVAFADYTLTITTSGAGSGSVTKDPDQPTYPPGTPV